VTSRMGRCRRCSQHMMLVAPQMLCYLCYRDWQKEQQYASEARDNREHARKMAADRGEALARHPAKGTRAPLRSAPSVVLGESCDWGDCNHLEHHLDEDQTADGRRDVL
jgi:hypothetical protein